MMLRVTRFSLARGTCWCPCSLGDVIGRVVTRAHWNAVIANCCDAFYLWSLAEYHAGAVCPGPFFCLKGIMEKGGSCSLFTSNLMGVASSRPTFFAAHSLQGKAEWCIWSWCHLVQDFSCGGPFHYSHSNWLLCLTKNQLKFDARNYGTKQMGAPEGGYKVY